MSLTSKINGKAKRDKEFKEILLTVEPLKENYYTFSKNPSFSGEYKLYVPYNLSNPYNATLVGTAFDYLARFRIAQFLSREDVINGMVSLKGFKKLWKLEAEFFRKAESVNEPYLSWMNEVRNYIRGSSIPSSSLYEIVVHLAKLELITRHKTTKETDVSYLLYDPAPIEVITELQNLFIVFEEQFMKVGIINKKSKVIFNPNFGVSSALVSGADADIFIDGTLYDFKTTQDKGLKKSDNLQMIGYYLLNELAIATSSDIFGFEYEFMDIKKIAFYKARFGEIEYYDANIHLPYEEVKHKLRELAEHFKEKQGRLNLMWMSDIDAAKRKLEEIRNGIF
jgi:hypothetical protein